MTSSFEGLGTSAGEGGETMTYGTPPIIFLPRRRNLWVADKVQWRPEARLAQPANPTENAAIRRRLVGAPNQAMPVYFTVNGTDAVTFSHAISSLP